MFLPCHFDTLQPLPMTQIPETEKWLSLSAAAKELGVHITTLRRWADSGDIPVMLTPGGHRRFSSGDIAKFSHQRSNLSPHNIETAWADQALTQTRQEIVVRRDHQAWITTFDDAARTQYRILGKQLLGLTMQYLSDENGGEILKEAAHIGRQYGQVGMQANLPLTEALEDLAKEDPVAARVVDLHHFAGLSHSDVAEVLGMSVYKTSQKWMYARAWLRSAIENVIKNGA